VLECLVLLLAITHWLIRISSLLRAEHACFYITTVMIKMIQRVEVQSMSRLFLFAGSDMRHGSGTMGIDSQK